jgi:hypothetical protein
MRAAMNLQEDADVKEIVPNARFCVRTTSQNRALLLVKSTDAPRDDPYNFKRIDFDVTVWSG